MKTSSFAQRLKSLMEQRNLRQVDILQLVKPLGEQRGIKLGKNDLSQYVNGKVEPGPDKLSLLSQALGVPEPWLMGYDAFPSPSNLTPLPKMNQIPLVGTIACGQPILAQEHRETYVDLPSHIQADYALTCRGDSMINAGISDGDIVYIRHQNEVENGQIAVILVDHEEATLKRFYRSGNVIQLIAENPRLPPMVYTGEQTRQVQIIGRAVAFTHILG